MCVCVRVCVCACVRVCVNLRTQIYCTVRERKAHVQKPFQYSLILILHTDVESENETTESKPVFRNWKPRSKVMCLVVS